jgi:hypothetical protein
MMSIKGTANRQVGKSSIVRDHTLFPGEKASVLLNDKLDPCEVLVGATSRVAHWRG